MSNRLAVVDLCKFYQEGQGRPEECHQQICPKCQKHLEIVEGFSGYEYYLCRKCKRYWSTGGQGKHTGRKPPRPGEFGYIDYMRE